MKYTYNVKISGVIDAADQQDATMHRYGRRGGNKLYRVILMTKTINLIDTPCPHCGKTHEAHRHENGATICEDGTIVAMDRPYNVVRMNKKGDIL